MQAFYVVHTDPERGGIKGAADRASRGFRINYPNDVWRAHLSYREFGDEWDPAVGFVQRRGIRRANPVRYVCAAARLVRQRAQPGVPLLPRASVRPPQSALDARDGLQLLGVVYDSGDRFDLRRNFRFEQLDAPFDIHPGVVLPVGKYTFDDWELRAESASHRRLSGRASITVGEFWSGNRSAVELALTTRPLPGVTVTTEWEHEDVDLFEGRFTTNLVRLLGSWHASPWVALDGISSTTPSRPSPACMRGCAGFYGLAATSYFVYTENWRSTADRFVTLSRGATTKINYTHRF